MDCTPYPIYLLDYLADSSEGIVAIIVDEAGKQDAFPLRYVKMDFTCPALWGIYHAL